MQLAASVSSLILGLGFGIPALLGLRHLSRTGDIWTFLGFPTYGGGPFEKIGVATTIPLMAGFLAVCVAEVVVGILIWRNSPSATALSLILLPFEMVFWVGFALPIGPVLGVARTALLLA